LIGDTAQPIAVALVGHEVVVTIQAIALLDVAVIEDIVLIAVTDPELQVTAVVDTVVITIGIVLLFVDQPIAVVVLLVANLGHGLAGHGRTLESTANTDNGDLIEAGTDATTTGLLGLGEIFVHVSITVVVT